jgi:hypothetical protein
MKNDSGLQNEGKQTYWESLISKHIENKILPKESNSVKTVF